MKIVCAVDCRSEGAVVSPTCSNYVLRNIPGAWGLVVGVMCWQDEGNAGVR